MATMRQIGSSQKPSPRSKSRPLSPSSTPSLSVSTSATSPASSSASSHHHSPCYSPVGSPSSSPHKQSHRRLTMPRGSPRNRSTDTCARSIKPFLVVAIFAVLIFQTVYRANETWGDVQQARFEAANMVAIHNRLEKGFSQKLELDGVVPSIQGDAGLSAVNVDVEADVNAEVDRSNPVENQDINAEQGDVQQLPAEQVSAEEEADSAQDAAEQKEDSDEEEEDSGEQEQDEEAVSSRTQNAEDDEETAAVVAKSASQTRASTATSPNSKIKRGTYDSYQASNHPVINPDKFEPSTEDPVYVHFLVDGSATIQPHSKMIMAGIRRSQYMQLASILYAQWGHINTVSLVDNADNSKAPSVLLVDWSSIKRDCNVLERVISQNGSAFLHIVLMDYSGSASQDTCASTNPSMPHDRIRLAKRNIVTDRSFDVAADWIHVGHIAPNAGAELSAGPTLQLPYVVRDVFVDAVRNMTHHSSKYVSKSIRSTDVAYFWDNGDYSHYAFFRNAVAKLMRTRQHTKAGKHHLTTWLGETKVVRDFEQTGNVQETYVQRLLKSKVVVVAQRDTAEDHFRLMDSLASGALVMTDVMLALPTGLHNGTNIIVYDGKASLKSLIRYYLNPTHRKERQRIAKKGWELAMGHHRSWHRLEELLFGKPLTQVGQPHADPPVVRTDVDPFEDG